MGHGKLNARCKEAVRSKATTAIGYLSKGNTGQSLMLCFTAMLSTHARTNTSVNNNLISRAYFANLTTCKQCM
eukprot:4521568-Amphidinium_carterae.1